MNTQYSPVADAAGTQAHEMKQSSDKHDDIQPHFAGNAVNKRRILLIIAVVLAVVAVVILVVVVVTVVLKSSAEEDYFYDSDFRHVNVNITTILHSIQSNGTDIYKPLDSLYRIGVVGDNLWLPVGYKKVSVIDQNGNDLYAFDFPSGVRSVLQVSESEVFIASREGLFIANTSGDIVQKLADAYCPDISKDRGRLATININNYHVIIFTQEDNEDYNTTSTIDSELKWKTKFNFSIHNPEEIIMGYKIKIMLFDDYIYICSPENSAIYKYDINIGVLLGTYKGTGYPSQLNKPQSLDYPRINAIDKHGTLLICNKKRNRYELLTESGDYKTIRVPFLKYNYLYPSDIAIVGKYLFAAFRSGSLTVLKKYEIPHQ